jgi:hypothetical protein
MTQTQGSTHGVKELLRSSLAKARARIVRSLDGLGEQDLRRPMTRSCTNLLGLIKHLTWIEYRVSDTFGRPREALPGEDDDELWFERAWATPEETKDDILAQYGRACDATDQIVDELELDEVGEYVGRTESLRARLIGLLAETYQHAGHADILRELIDGHNASNDAPDEWWETLRARMRGEVGPEAWDKFRTPELEARMAEYRRYRSALRSRQGVSS